MIIDFPETFEKFAPSLVRTGKWDAAKTFMTEALRNTDVLDKIGSPVVGLRGTAASAAGGPAGDVVRGVLEEERQGREAVHRLRGHGARRGERGVPRRAAGVLVVAREDQGEPRRASRARPGRRSRTRSSRRRSSSSAPARRSTTRARSARSTSTRKGDIGSAVFEIWKYSAAGKIDTPEDGHVPGLMRQTLQGGRRLRGGRRLLPRRAHRAARRRQRHRGARTAATPTRRRAEALAARARRRRRARRPPRGRAAHAPAARAGLRLARARSARTARRSPGIDPANTTYFVSGFIPEGVLVEVELDAIVAEPPR